jgi:hypothetical protein
MPEFREEGSLKGAMKGAFLRIISQPYISLSNTSRSPNPWPIFCAIQIHARSAGKLWEQTHF